MLSIRGVLVGVLAVTGTSAALAVPPATAKRERLANEKIDFAGFVRVAQEVAPLRDKRRVTQEQFLEMAREKGTLILDTRSAAAYAEVHVAGAVHLNFSDITKERVEKVLGDKKTRILIYCNNNFESKRAALASKTIRTALNIPTFITLYEYGYRNVYELGPVVDEQQSLLPLVSGKEPGSLSSRQPSVEIPRKQSRPKSR